MGVGGGGWELILNSTGYRIEALQSTMRNICYKLRGPCTVFEKISPPLIPPSATIKG